MTASTTLRKDALGLVQAAAIGVAGTAPAYTIAVSSAALVAAVGALAPAMILYCGFAMVGITFAFAYLNRAHPDAGASYAWVGRVLHPDLGFLCGWAVLVSSVLFTVSATIPAATATLQLARVAPTQGLVTGVAAAWIVAITLLEVQGMGLTGKVQAWMTGIELAVLGVLSVAALARMGPQVLDLVTWGRFAPSAFTPEAFAAGSVIAVFFFWGWDVALNVSEETRDPGRVPGLAAALAIAAVAITFMALALVTLAVLGETGIRDSGTNLLFAVADKLLPRPWSRLALVAVMLSSVGSLQVSLLQFARTLYSQARAGEANARWSKVHARWQTPHLATWLNCGLGLALLALSLAFDGIDAMLKASINAIGLEIAFYYGLTALACAWHYRWRALRSPHLLLFAVAWPLLSAAALWGTAVLAARGMDGPTLGIGLGGLALGLLPLAFSPRRNAAPSAPPSAPSP